MASKWQLWMPFQIDRFKASPAVRAMHPAARSGYLYLITFQWQTDDCTIPSDPIALAEISEVGDELWALHGARIMRNFKPVDDTDKLRNEVCFKEWQEAKFIYERRREAAEKTTATRSPSGHRLRKVKNVQRSADTRTRTLTGTYTQTETIKPSRATLEEIYQAYPKHVAKTAALKAIETALQKSNLRPEAMLAKVTAYAQQRAKEDPQFTPFPATWFNQGRYADETLQPKPKLIWEKVN